MMGWWLAVALATTPVVPDPSAIDDDGTEALDAYLAERLGVVERPVSTVYAKGYDGSGQFWFVTRGGRSLSAVRFAEAVGDDDTVRRHRNRKRSLTALGLGSLALGVGTGFVATVRGASLLEESTPASTALFGVLAGGTAALLAGGSLVLSRPVRMVHPSALYTEDEARSRAQAQNALLRAQHLGEE